MSNRSKKRLDKEFTTQQVALVAEKARIGIGRRHPHDNCGVIAQGYTVGCVDGSAAEFVDVDNRMGSAKSPRTNSNELFCGDWLLECVGRSWHQMKLHAQRTFQM
jgi:hypothetical protein